MSPQYPSHTLLPLVSTLCLVLTILCGDTHAQRFEGSYDGWPEYVIVGGPLVSGGLTTYRVDGSAGYTIHADASYSAGLVVAFLHMHTASKFFAVPVLGLQYDSRAVTFVDNQASETSLRVNSCGVLVGLVFPFVQALLSVDVPIGGSSAKRLESDVERVVTIHPGSFNISIEPRIIFYYPIPTSSDQWDALAPYISVGFPLTNVFHSAFDPASQTFGSSPGAIGTLRLSSVQIGLVYGFELFRHYPPGRLL